MSRTRASLITAVVLVVLGIAASQFVPTQAAWNDSAFFTATASTGTWMGNGDISDGGISVGNTTTAITDISWSITSPTRFCVVVTVTGTSSTPQPWQLDVDLTRPPFNGVTVNDVSIQRGETAPGPGNTMIVTGTMRPGRPFNRNNNNSPITDAQEAFPRLCVSDAPLAQGDPSWYTVTVTEGTGTTWSPDARLPHRDRHHQRHRSCAQPVLLRLADHAEPRPGARPDHRRRRHTRRRRMDAQPPAAPTSTPPRPSTTRCSRATPSPAARTPPYAGRAAATRPRP